MSETHTGSCLCGAVRIRTTGKLRGVVYCHCAQCRKQTGHFYAATSVFSAHLEVQGEDNVGWYKASSTALRGFCRTCGSALFWKRVGSENVAVLAGLFDRPTGLYGEAHIFTESKGEYYEITDDLPQYPGTGRGSVT
jgi:hypothetical protein